MRILYKIQNYFIKQIINHAAAVSAANEYEKDIFLSINEKTKVEIIRNGINLQTLISKHNFRKKYQIDSKFILFVGRFSKSKGIETLIHSFNIIKNEKEIEDAKLVIMGVDFGFEKEMEELIKIEKPILLKKITDIEAQLTKILITSDPNDNKNAIIEIRAGTGGDEAALFAADLFRMYSKYAEKNGMSIKVMDMNEIGVGGLKSIIFNVQGENSYGMYKYEGGVHRVQRIPKTESVSGFKAMYP